MGAATLSRPKTNSSVVNNYKGGLKRIRRSTPVINNAGSLSQSHWQQQKGNKLAESGDSLLESNAVFITCTVGTIKRVIYTHLKQIS